MTSALANTNGYSTRRPRAPCPGSLSLSRTSTSGCSDWLTRKDHSYLARIGSAVAQHPAQHDMR
eukprot:4160382-Prymnesium_polylepis.1